MRSKPRRLMGSEGQDVFLRAIGTPLGSRVVVAVGDLEERLDAWIRFASVSGPNDAGGHPRPNLSTAYIEPRTETEEKLAAIWSAQLGVDKVGVHDQFFELGGHSLLAIQVAAEIRNTFAIEIPVLQLFKAPTVAQLAVLVENTR